MTPDLWAQLGAALEGSAPSCTQRFDAPCPDCGRPIPWMAVGVMVADRMRSVSLPGGCRCPAGVAARRPPMPDEEPLPLAALEAPARCR